MREVYIVIVIALITFLLRALPFIAFNRKNELPPLMLSLQKELPMAVMILLVIYCIKDISFTALNTWLPYLLSIALVAYIHHKRKNVLFSILLGTFFYMFCVQYLFK